MTPGIVKRVHELYEELGRKDVRAVEDLEKAQRENRKEIIDPAKAKPQPEAKAKTPSDLTAQIAKRAYKLYEERGRKDGSADQDWEQAEREIRKPEAKTEPKPEAKEEPKPEAKAEPQPEAKTETPSDLTPRIAKRAYEFYEQRGRQDGRAVQDWEQAEREIRKDEANAAPEPEVKAEPKPEAKAKTPSDLTPGIVKRVHELYEELGRKDLQAVEGLEKVQRENRKEIIDPAKAKPRPSAEAEPKPEAEAKTAGGAGDSER